MSDYIYFGFCKCRTEIVGVRERKRRGVGWGGMENVERNEEQMERNKGVRKMLKACIQFSPTFRSYEYHKEILVFL